MKKLDFEQMEQVHGGKTYCELLGHWLIHREDYQGNDADLYSAYYNNCYGK